MANLISDQIIQAVNILTDKRFKDLKFDRTIETTIKAIEDLNTGKYSVEYNGNNLSVYSKNLQEKYKVGDKVFITIPEGDLSNKKFIQNRSTSKSLSEEELEELQNSYVPVGPTLDTIYEYNYSTETEDWGLTAHGTDKGAFNAFSIFSNSNTTTNKDNTSDTMFQQYAKEYSFLLISAKFKTNFYSDFTKGNYGIKIVFNLIQGDSNPFGTETYECYFDTNQFNGNPYKFINYNTQTNIIKIPNRLVTGIQSIQFFEEGFPNPDVQIIYDKETGKENPIYITNNNIFLKDLTLQFVEQIDYTKDLYYLQLETPSGTIFTNSNDSLTITGKLINQGQSILNKSNGQCFWFKRDPSITLNSKGYEKDAGPGWKRIGVDKNVLEKFNFNTLTVPSGAVNYQMEYKLIVQYNNQLIQKSISLMQLNSGYDLTIQKENEGDDWFLVLKKKIDGEYEKQENLVGNWYVEHPDGRYEKLTTETEVNQLNITSYLVYPYLTFYCNVTSQNAQGESIGLGTIKYILQQSASSVNAVTVSFMGDTVCKYDANGDISLLESENTKTLRCILNQKMAYKLKWYLRDPIEQTYNEIPEGKGFSQKQLENTMFRTLSVSNDDKFDRQPKLQYNIKQKYDRSKANNNIIQAKITTIDDGQVYTFNQSIEFLKDGDQGTNGTTYYVTITPTDNKYLKYNESNNNTWNHITLTASVKEVGNPAQILNVTHKWSLGPDLKFCDEQGELKKVTDAITGESKEITIDTGDTIQVIGAGNPDQASKQYYVKLQTTIAGKTTLYSLYPVNVLVNGATQPVDEDISISQYIEYNSSGERPSYDRDPIHYTEKYSIESLNTDLLEIDKDNILKPTSKFLFNDNQIPVIKFTEISTNKYILYPIIMYLNTYGNEAINGWDGTKLEIDGEGQYILAPQIGAGEKDTSNKFTGVVMGTAYENGQKRTGLYGYSGGKNTFALKENGAATFGKSDKGQIIIDGNSSVIQSANFRENESGMYLNLLDGTLKSIYKDNKDSQNIINKVQLTSDPKKKPLSIGHQETDGNTKFYVDWDGSLHATGTINAKSGSIGNVNIENGAISNGNFKVTSGGQLRATDAFITGEIHMGKNSKITWGDEGVPHDSTIADAQKVADKADQNIKDLANGEKVVVGYKQDQWGESYPIYGTFINGKTIQSPTIEGGTIYARNAFIAQHQDTDWRGEPTGTYTNAGYFGPAQGKDANNDTTYGVALSITSPQNLIAPDREPESYPANDSYLIVTDGGVRMTRGSNSVVVTEKSITLNSSNTYMIRVNSEGCKYHTPDMGANVWLPIGGGQITAIWG